MSGFAINIKMIKNNVNSMKLKKNNLPGPIKTYYQKFNVIIIHI